MLLCSFLIPATAVYPQTSTTPVYFSVTGHWYQFIAPVSWTTATQWAQDHGGYLATATSPEENAFLVAILDQVHSAAYLGGYEPNNDGVWIWVTGELWSYTNWIPGQPDNTGGNENYLGLTPSYSWGWGMWNDAADAPGQ